MEYLNWEERINKMVIVCNCLKHLIQKQAQCNIKLVLHGKMNKVGDQDILQLNESVVAT